MSIKSDIKNLIGPQNVSRIQTGKALLKYIGSNMPGSPDRFTLKSGEWNEPLVFSQPGKHVFFGYYDIQQISRKQDKMLVTMIPLRADTQKDKAELQWIDLESGEYHAINTTTAWCWQQGARLRWHPFMEDLVLYNDVEKDRYVTRLYDLNKRCTLEVFPRAMYDVSPDFCYGLSLNYSRLQRLRPGYGYNTLPDHTVNEKVPEGDGIFLVDLKTGEVKCIITYEELVERTPEARNEWNYINHISIAPDGKHFIFFHLYTPEVGGRWHAKLYVAKQDGSDLQCLEEEYITSHYCWKNENELLTTTVGRNGNRSYYFSYNITDKKRVTVDSEHLTHDGHPSFLPDKEYFIADTYPLNRCMQHLFSSSIDGRTYNPICDLYSDPRLYGEKRCDLHPRITPDGRFITVDSTYREGKRNVLLFQHK